MKIKNNYPLIAFSFVSFMFFVFFTHLILKTDDGHFLGILNEENFVLSEWLRERYLNISGRTASEFLMMSFLKINPIFWKISASVLFVFIACFLQKISGAFSGYLSQNQKNIFSCCVPFLVFIGALNSGAFWFAGSFTYLFPFAAFLTVILPLAFDLLNINYNKIIFNTLAVISALLASSQEQTAALTLAFSAVLIVLLALNKKIKWFHFLSLPFSIMGAYHLFSSSGMAGRMEMESGTFERFNEMNMIEKIICGFSNYFGYSFFMSIIVTGVFAVLLTMSISSLYGDRKAKAFSKIFIIFLAVVCGGINLFYIAIKHTIPDKGFQKMFESGEYDGLNLFVIASCFVLLLVFALMIVLLIKKSPTIGVAVALCFGAAVCNGIVMGFSSSIYASGQRVFYFTDMLLLIASVIMISSLNNKKVVIVYNFAIIAALLQFIFNCFNFALLEVPVMG